MKSIASKIARIVFYPMIVFTRWFADEVYREEIEEFKKLQKLRSQISEGMLTTPPTKNVSRVLDRGEENSKKKYGGSSF